MEDIKYTHLLTCQRPDLTTIPRDLTFWWCISLMVLGLDMNEIYYNPP